MYTYDDFAELARICAKNSHIASSKEVSAKLWELATEYRDKADQCGTGERRRICWGMGTSCTAAHKRV
jgi:hypothetical protein